MGLEFDSFNDDLEDPVFMGLSGESEDLIGRCLECCWEGSMPLGSTGGDPLEILSSQEQLREDHKLAKPRCQGKLTFSID